MLMQPVLVVDGVSNEGEPIDVNDPDFLAAAWATPFELRTQAQWVAIWQSTAREMTACDAASSGSSGFHCVRQPIGHSLLWLAVVLVGLGLVAGAVHLIRGLCEAVGAFRGRLRGVS